MYAAGVKQVVASRGTALTANQVRAIKVHLEFDRGQFDPDTAAAPTPPKINPNISSRTKACTFSDLNPERGLYPDEFIKRMGRRVCLVSAACDGLFPLARRSSATQLRYVDGRRRIAGFEAVLLPPDADFLDCWNATERGALRRTSCESSDCACRFSRWTAGKAGR